MEGREAFEILAGIDEAQQRINERLRTDPEYRARYAELMAEHGNPHACAVWAAMDVDYCDSAYSRAKAAREHGDTAP